jgi:2-dehydro-3-deoxygluconokinase
MKIPPPEEHLNHNKPAGKTVLVIGEPMIELSTPSSLTKAESYQRSWGGDALITACALGGLTTSKQLPALERVTVKLLCGLSDDGFTGGLQRLCKQHHVDLSPAISKPNAETALYMVSQPKAGVTRHSDAGERVFYRRKHSPTSQLSLTDIGDNQGITRLLNGVDIVMASGIGLAISDCFREVILAIFKAAHQQGITTCLDTNIRPRLWDSDETKGVDTMRNTIRMVLPYTNVCLPSLPDDTLALLDLDDPYQCANYFHAHMAGGATTQQASIVFLKADSSGCYVSFQRGRHHAVQHVAPSQISNVSNTIGAGDTFNAGVIAGLLAQQPLATCAHWGNTLAGMKIQGEDTIESLPEAKTFSAALGV